MISTPVSLTSSGLTPMPLVVVGMYVFWVVLVCV